jgi:hypothetical protein
VATGASDVCGWIRETRVAVEAPTRSQTDEDLARASLESLLQLDGVIARVEDEQRSSGPLLLILDQEAHERSQLLGGYLVGVLRRTEALHVHGGNPALADEVELRDELVGPSCDDGLPGRVAGGMVVETSLGAALRVAAIPHAHVYGIYRRFASGERMASEQPPQSLSADTSAIQCSVEAAPAATMRHLQAQVGRRRGGTIGG